MARRTRALRQESSPIAKEPGQKDRALTEKGLVFYTAKGGSTILLYSVGSTLVISGMSIMISLPSSYYEEDILCILLFHFSLIFIKITIKRRVASLELPAKFPRLPALLIG